MKRLLILGSAGLLGINWAIHTQDKYKVFTGFNKKKIQLKKTNNCHIEIQNIESIYRALDLIKPDILVNCIGYADVDLSESNLLLATFLNSEVPKILAKASLKYKIAFIHISTDHLFKGNLSFRKETDKVSPLNTYAKTKIKGEKNISEINKNALIIRTNFFCWGPPYRVSLSDFIINTLTKKSNINLFNDVYFTPILASHLVDKSMDLVNNSKKGIFNISSNERITKYEFGLKIAKIFGLEKKLINSVNLVKLHQYAQRPLDMSLCNKKFKENSKIKFSSIKNQIEELLIQRNKKDFKKIRAFKKNNSIKDFKIIPYGKHFIDKKDIAAVVKVLKNNPLTQGPLIEVFEKEFAKYVGAKYAVAVSSCTAGLHICTLSTGISKNEYLLTSPITFVASANAAIYSGAKVVFSDIEKESINISPKQIITTIKSLKKNSVKIIMPVHFAGYPCDMKKIKKIADSNNAVIIEDAAHALGSKYHCGSNVGSCKYSSMTVFSMHPVKAIASGEGGVITTNSDAIYRQLLKLRSHGINKLDDAMLNTDLAYTGRLINPWYYEMQEIGFNYRITDFQCALAQSQLKKLHKFLSKRKKMVKFYDKYFYNNLYITPIQNKYRSLSSHHLYLIKINFKKLKLSRSDLMYRLKEKGIISQVHYIPVPLHPFYKKKGYSMKNYQNAMQYYNMALSIPLYYTLSLKDQKFVADTISNIIEKSK